MWGMWTEPYRSEKTLSKRIETEILLRILVKIKTKLLHSFAIVVLAKLAHEAFKIRESKLNNNNNQ